MSPILLAVLRFFGYFTIGSAIAQLAISGYWSNAIMLGLGGFALATYAGVMESRAERLKENAKK